MKTIKLNASKLFGPQLRKERLKRGITQTELSKKMNCTSGNVSHFELGDGTRGNGSIKTVFQYAKALEVKQVVFDL